MCKNDTTTFRKLASKKDNMAALSTIKKSFIVKAFVNARSFLIICGIKYIYFFPFLSYFFASFTLSGLKL